MTKDLPAPPAAVTKPAPQSLDDLKAIQDRARAVLDKIIPTTVCLRVGGATGSGVIVSEDGLVLTAGHVSGEPGRKIKIVLYDGRVVNGETLGRNREIDSGMARITDKGPWPYAELGVSKDLKAGQWCIATGHPGGFKKDRPPVVRVGRVGVFNDSLIQTDCTLVGGDSGGPLFDMTGKVIGIHSRIGNPIVANIHVPADTYREYWDQLAAGEKVGENPVGSGSGRTWTRRTAGSGRSPRTPRPTRPAEGRGRNRQVRRQGRRLLPGHGQALAAAEAGRRRGRGSEAQGRDRGPDRDPRQAERLKPVGQALA